VPFWGPRWTRLALRRRRYERALETWVTARLAPRVDAVTCVEPASAGKSRAGIREGFSLAGERCPRSSTSGSPSSVSRICCGLGVATVREALARGQSVTANARDPGAIRRAFGTSPSLLPAKVDVTDERQIREAVDATIARFGRIDVLVNNAGFGLIAAVEEASDAAARAIFNVSVFGVLNLRCAPYSRLCAPSGRDM
jgi:hypothetical protein